jgi:flagellar operon protein
MQIRVTNDPSVQRPELTRPITHEKTQSVGKPGQGTFAQVLEETRELEFSKHAKERLSTWGQSLDEKRLGLLRNAVSQASEKGAKTTLVLMKEVAFVVAPKTRTVVTVIPKNRMKENVFTSIDSAVLAEEL